MSLFNEEYLVKLSQSKDYTKTPFLFLIASLNRNEAIKWASYNFKYENKCHKGAWMVYKFNN